MSGKFVLLLKPQDFLAQHVLDYINFSKKQDKFYSEIESVLNGENYDADEEQLLNEQSNYNDLIDSDEWIVREGYDEITQILIPVFCFDGLITWRLK